MYDHLFGDVVDKHGVVVGVVEEKLRERGGQVCQPRGDLPYLCLSVRRESGPRPHRAAVLLVEQPALRLGQPEFIGPLVQRRNTCEQFGIHRDGVEVIGERRRQVLGDLVDALALHQALEHGELALGEQSMGRPRVGQADLEDHAVGQLGVDIAPATGDLANRQQQQRRPPTRRLGKPFRAST